jgi:hypothetical protein
MKRHEPEILQYQGYKIAVSRTTSIGSVSRYYTAVAHKGGHQKLYAHGTQTHCTTTIQSLIDEQVRIRSLASPDLIPLGTMAARPARSRPKI